MTTASIFGTPSVGAFCAANDRVALIPADAPDKFERQVRETLQVESVVRCKVGGARIVGVLVAINNHGLVLPKIVTDEELSALRQALGADFVIEVLESKHTALGNLILVNDRAALVFPGFRREELRLIEDALDVEVVQGRIAGLDVVGSAGVVNNYGLLVHPDASEAEIERLRELFRVTQADAGTVNRGVPFIRLGLVANNKGALAGDETTGPELMHIGNVLGVTGGEPP